MGGPVLLVFVRPGIVNRMASDCTEQKRRSRMASSEQRLAFANANNMASLWVRAGSCSASSSGSEERCFKTTSTSQVDVYLGRGGLLLKRPFMNLDTTSCCPTRTPSISLCVMEMADLIVLRVRYCFPELYSSSKNSRILLRGAETGCRSLVVHQPSHFLQTEL